MAARSGRIAAAARRWLAAVRHNPDQHLVLPACVAIGAVLAALAMAGALPH